jgi:hypothetical protein
VINQPMAARNPPGQIDSIISRHRLSGLFRVHRADQLRALVAATRQARPIDFIGLSGRCPAMKREARQPLNRENPTPGLDFSGLSAQ